MKKKHRNITVEGVEYAWLVRYFDTIVIFKDKKIIYEKPEKSNNPITPKRIEEIIKSLNANDCLIQDSCMSFGTEKCNKECKLYL